MLKFHFPRLLHFLTTFVLAYFLYVESNLCYIRLIQIEMNFHEILVIIVSSDFLFLQSVFTHCCIFSSNKIKVIELYLHFSQSFLKSTH